MKQTQPMACWPTGDGRPIGILRMTPDEAAIRYQLEFAEGSDDLDTYRLAAIEDADVRQLWLFRHDGSPCDGVEVQVDMAVSRTRALAAVERQLGLGAAAFEWTTAYETDPRLEFVV